jgi:hypothetical protein
MVLRNGDVWLLRRSVAEQAALSVRALQDLTAKKGPARVTLQDALGPKQLGVVDMGGPGAFFGVQSSGPVTLSWQFPGGALVEKSIVIEEGEFRIWLGDGFPRTR